MARIKWAKQKKRPKSRRAGSKQPKPLLGFSAKNVPFYLLSFLLFCFSKEIFSYDEEFIIISCLFIVFFVLIEGLKNQVDIFFTQCFESMLDFYLERFLFTKWGLIKMKNNVKYLMWTHLQVIYIIFHLQEVYFYLSIYNTYFRQLYINLLWQEGVSIYYVYESLMFKNFYLYITSNIIKNLKNLR